MSQLTKEQRQRVWICIEYARTIDIRIRDKLATLLLFIFYLQLSTPEANIAQLVW